MRIIDKLEPLIKKGKPFYSFEFFPPKTEAGLYNLYERIDRMAGFEPAFIDVTWGAGGSTSEMSLDITRTAQQYCGLEVMMHLTCTNMPRVKIDAALKRLKDEGVTNILALRGDPPRGEQRWEQCEDGFSYASDLVRYIRDKYDTYFGIAVSGYPEGHLEAESKEADIINLKKKVDAGADFIVTQLFYDCDEFFAFVDRCRAIGIACPIIPGILPVHNYERFRRFTDFCRTKVPDEVNTSLEAIKNDDEAVRVYGVELGAKMCKTLLDRKIPGLHFYTLNLESSTMEILDKLGFVSKTESRRALPWRPSTLPSRVQEEVRPIFWANRPKSYLARTRNWDDFPNGRWGDSHSPSFGNLNEYYMLRQGMGYEANRKKNLKAWGTPTTTQEVIDVFVSFCEGKIPRLPWSEGEVHGETGRILSPILKMNQHGFLTINSQPQVNGESSLDPNVGWGGPDGVVYQKAYIEFFMAPERLEPFLAAVKEFPTLTYHCVNMHNESHSNVPRDHVNAVTWGVFPAREILQPTVVDSTSFMIWKDEAFDLWLEEWGTLYDRDSASYKLLKGIRNSYYLVNLVENNFISGNIFGVFERLY